MAPRIRQLLGLQARESYSWTCGGRAYHALHGDRFDSFVSDHARLADVLSWLYAFSMRWLSLRGEWPRWIDRYATARLGLCEKVAQGAKHLAAADPFDVIVCGHTHEPLHRVFPDVRGPAGRGVEYFNSGSWLDRPASFLSVDAVSGVRINSFA